MAANFTDSTPAAPAGNINVKWQHDDLGRGSGYVPTGAGLTFADNETPSGTVDGVNAVFVLAHTPSPGGSLQFFVNGVMQLATTDYTLSVATVTFGAAPLTGALLRAYYRY